MRAPVPRSISLRTPQTTPKGNNSLLRCQHQPARRDKPTPLSLGPSPATRGHSTQTFPPTGFENQRLSNPLAAPAKRLCPWKRHLPRTCAPVFTESRCYYPVIYHVIILPYWLFYSIMLIFIIVLYSPIYFYSLTSITYHLLSYLLPYCFLYLLFFPPTQGWEGVGTNRASTRAPFPSLLLALTLQDVSQHAPKTTKQPWAHTSSP